jgi:hypothetical protein
MVRFRVEAVYGEGKKVRQMFESEADARSWIDGNKFVEKKTRNGVVKMPYSEYVIVRVTEEVMGRCHG